VEDIEKIREMLGIEKWMVFGGSWGSTLSLTYAISYPERVTELVLRGIFMLREKELNWYYEEGGASFICPDYWEKYKTHIPEEERHNLKEAYFKRLTSDDPKIQIAAAQEWTRWEMGTSRLHPAPEVVESTADKFALAFARIENHFFINKGWFPVDGWILKEAPKKIAHIPTVIVQGRYDVVCPATSAYELFSVLKNNASLKIISDAGHSAGEPGIRSELIRATDRFGGKQ